MELCVFNCTFEYYILGGDFNPFRASSQATPTFDEPAHRRPRLHVGSLPKITT